MYIYIYVYIYILIYIHTYIYIGAVQSQARGSMDAQWDAVPAEDNTLPPLTHLSRLPSTSAFSTNPLMWHNIDTLYTMIDVRAC